jgi:hypothetical protein
MERVPYASVVGSLMYVLVCTQTKISHAVGVLRRYRLTPRKEHWIDVKRVFRYFCGMKDYDICYQGIPGGDSGKVNVYVFLDVVWARDLDRQKLTSGYVFKMFSGAIIWMSK